MKVSLITITFNSERTLEDTIQSVIAQDYPNIEYIIIDGMSKDGTMAIVDKYRTNIAKVVSEPDRGLYDAMNKGWMHATGEIVGYLNSDDFFACNDAVSTVVREFEKDPTLDGVHANLFYVNADNTDRIVRYWKTTEYKPGAFRHGWHPAHPTFYARRKCYEKLGGFRLDMPLSADFELMLRFIEVNKLKTKHLDKVLVLSPKNVYAQYNKGCVYAKNNNLTSAISSFTAAIEEKDDFGEAYYNRGLAYLQLGNKEKGISDLSKAGELGILPSYSILKRMN